MAKVNFGKKRNLGDKEGAPGTVIPEGDTVSVYAGLAWLQAAGVDTAAIKTEWQECANHGEYARKAVIDRIIDRHGLRVVLMKHARNLLEKQIV